jgi:two-component system, chemotaxis family, protein-glutamate methylesterase/glutaminase
MPVRVLVIDDSALVRNILSRALAAFDEIEIVGAAPDPFTARDLIVQLQPDVVTLDVELPHMDGITFLRKLMRYYPLPVIVVSSLTPKGSTVALDAMEAGALDVVCKPHHGHSLAAMAADLAAKIVAAAQADPGRSRQPASPAAQAPVVKSRTPRRSVIVGGSLGATNALLTMLASLPADGPEMVAALHMPGRFTGEFAKRLDRVANMTVTEARDGDRLERGLCLLVPGDQHAVIQSVAAIRRVRLKDGPPVASHRPSINVLFKSAARALQADAVGVVLTGMGDDGAVGLREMHDAGAATVAQDQATSVVFGMPKAAIEAGAIDQVAALGDIPGLIVELASRTAAGTRLAGRPG